MALLRNLANALIVHKRIVTTLVKAKALRVFVEPLLTKSKNNITHSRRIVFSYLQSKEAVKELFNEVAVKVASRAGGYTRIIKLGIRPGDNAELAMIELVDYNTQYTVGGTPETGAAKKTRRTRGKKKSRTEPISAEPATQIQELTEQSTIDNTPESPAV